MYIRNDKKKMIFPLVKEYDTFTSEKSNHFLFRITSVVFIVSLTAADLNSVIWTPLISLFLNKLSSVGMHLLY